METAQDSDSFASPAPVRSYAVSVCSFLVVIAFFLPWAPVSGVATAGYQLGRISPVFYLAWLIPISAAITVALGLVGFDQTFSAIVTGMLPIAFFGAVAFTAGDSLMTNGVSWGGCFTLLFGYLALIFSALAAARQTSDSD